MLSNDDDDDIYNYVLKNKDDVWHKWLRFESLLHKPGKQGIVGLFQTNTKSRKRILFKMSQYINYLAQHEHTIMKGLNEIDSFCPYFCKTYGYITSTIEPNFKEVVNPFKITSKYPINQELLLCEYIENSSKFCNYIKDSHYDSKTIFSIIKQVLLALTIAQKYKQFTHYDLHSNNIMIRKCKKDVVFLFVIDEDNQFLVPSNGYFPIIIDFGFSYIQDLDDGPLWPTLSHTDVGFISDRFDPIADPKLFLVTVSSELVDYRRDDLDNISSYKKFRRIVKNMFYNLKIDWDSGWDRIKDIGASDHVIKYLEPYNIGSNLFREYDHFCIDLIQSLIILPLRTFKYDNIGKTYQIFLKEWIKIEQELKNPFYHLYILKGLVDVARNVQPEYMSKSKATRDESIKFFRHRLFDRIHSVTKFCNPKNINFEILLCSLLQLARNIEGMLFDIVKDRMNEKELHYQKLPLKSIEQIYGAIEVNVPHQYLFNDKTNIVVFDCIKKKTELFKPSTKDINTVNSLDNLTQGTYIYDLIFNKQSI